jgi:hypothetical protein
VERNVCICGHDEREHETVEYRGDKQRCCFHIDTSTQTRCKCRAFEKDHVSRQRTWSEQDVMQFLGYLSIEIPELHTVEIPRLHDAWLAYVKKTSA